MNKPQSDFVMRRVRWTACEREEKRERERGRESERAVDRPSISHRDHENFTMLEFQNDR